MVLRYLSPAGEKHAAGATFGNTNKLKKDGVEFTKGIVQAAVLVFGGEELKLGYNIADLTTTVVSDIIKDKK